MISEAIELNVSFSRTKVARKVRLEIEKICKRGFEELLEYHILPVVRYSIFFSEYYPLADSEVVEIASWLHDIKKLRDNRKNHHVRGAVDARELLKKLDYPNNKIKRVEGCILTHSLDDNYPPKTIEEKILAASDALAHFKNFARECYNTYNKKRLGIEEGRIWLIEKYKAHWGKILIPEAVEIAKPYYENITNLLSGESRV